MPSLSILIEKVFFFFSFVNAVMSALPEQKYGVLSASLANKNHWVLKSVLVGRFEIDPDK